MIDSLPQRSHFLVYQAEDGMPATYASVFAEIKKRVSKAQYTALKSVNKQLVGLCWDIGQIIVERQAGETWGQAIVQQVAGDLQREFPDVGGFSASNLWRMKAFHEAYSALEKLAPLVREIAWSHNLIILERCSDLLEQEFYLRMTRKFGWSKNVLIHQIENQSYEKSLLGQTNVNKAPANKSISAGTCEIVKRLPKALKDQLSGPEQIAKFVQRPAVQFVQGLLA